MKLFGGDKQLVTSLFARVQAIESAETIKDIIVQPTFRFHKLENKGHKKYKGCFAIDVKTRREPWRIILQPLDDSESPFDGTDISLIAGSVRIVEIQEVSKHYE